MTKLVIFRGLPASGKSSEAKRLVAENIKNTIRVNMDSLREMFHESVFLGEDTENEIQYQRDRMIRDGLRRGKTVISDDTNLKLSTVNRQIDIGKHYGAEIEIIDFKTDVNLCIYRDALRVGKAHVGEKPIRDMWNRYVKNGFPKNPLLNNSVDPVIMHPYVPNGNFISAVVFDIDGTLAKMVNRSPYDYSKVSSDECHYDVLEMLLTFSHLNVPIIILSGRPESCRKDTEEWLRKYNIIVDNVKVFLYMRQTDDTRADYIVKYELFDKYIRNNYRIKAWFDDRQQVVDAMRNIGIRVYQVAPGDF